MKKSMNQLFSVFLLIMLSISCSDTGKPSNFDYGKVENNTYTNSFFSMEVKLPEKWVVQSKEQTDNLSKMGKDLVAGDDENLKAVMDASEINTANLLTVFQHEVGTAVDFNPSFMLIAENLKSAPGIKKGSDYLFQSRKLLEQSQVEYSHIDEEFEKESIDYQQFYTMNCSIDYMGVSIKQRYYSTIINGFSLNAIISYSTDEQRAELEKVINSMRF